MRSDGQQNAAWLALALCSSGRPDAWLSLAHALGGPLQVVTASDQALAERQVGPAAVALLRAAWPSRAVNLVEKCARLGIGVAPLGSADYPSALADIKDPPLVLFWRGAPPSVLSICLAVVGARRCTDYGERTAAWIGREAAGVGIVVLSGLARGIDAAAHRGALESGQTAAVLAGGLDRIYPGEHRSLADRIVGAGGSLLSEQPPGVRPLPWLFPFRNRIITGLSLATVVVEASVRSGSLASARHALDQGREVFAVPGPIDSPVSAGTNRLLGEGAAPFCRIDDLAAVAGFSKLVKLPRSKSLKNKGIDELGLSPESAAVLRLIEAGKATADEIEAATALDGTRVLALLTALELDGLIRREAHGRFRRDGTSAGRRPGNGPMEL